MCNEAFPVLQQISIEKHGNRSGSFNFINPLNGNETRIEFQGSFPFSKPSSNDEPTGYQTKPDTQRLHIFVACCHLLRLSFDGKCAPYRFQCSQGSKWKMDKKCALWLQQEPDWSVIRDTRSGNIFYEFASSTAPVRNG